MMSVLNSISSYFNQSAIRNLSFRSMAIKKKLKILHIPKLFEIRWTEFAFKLVKSILVSWNAIVLFFSNSNDVQAKGFLTFLTQLSNLKFITFVGDQRFQRKTQSNELHIVSLNDYINQLVSAVEQLAENAIPGGFESALNDTLRTDNDGKIFRKDIEIFTAVLGRNVSTESLNRRVMCAGLIEC